MLKQDYIVLVCSSLNLLCDKNKLFKKKFWLDFKLLWYTWTWLRRRLIVWLSRASSCKVYRNVFKLEQIKLIQFIRFICAWFEFIANNHTYFTREYLGITHFEMYKAAVQRVHNVNYGRNKIPLKQFGWDIGFLQRRIKKTFPGKFGQS